MLRLRLYDVRNSRMPQLLGLCAADVLRVAQYVNGAQRRLIYAAEAGEESWWGTWAEIAFNVSLPATTAAPTLPGPYATFDQSVARIEAVNVCNRPMIPHKQFFEYLQFGNGRLPKMNCTCDRPLIRQLFTRNNVPTFVDLFNPPQIIQVVWTNPTDIPQTRVLLQGLDNNNNIIYSQDGLNRVLGIFLQAQAPFATAPIQLNQITGIQKDITNGPVQVFQLDPNTGVQTLLVTMQPNEQTANYRRYYFDNLPPSCCFSGVPVPNNPVTTPTLVPVTAIVKLELLPVFVDTDYLLLQNLEAIIEESQSIRYDEVDNPPSHGLSLQHHKSAIRLLNGELFHYLGKNDPAVEWAPWGSARLEKNKIGLLI